MPLVSGILYTKTYKQFQILLDDETLHPLDCLTVAKALPGDTITYDTDTKECSLVKRTKHYPIVGVVELASKTKYGMTSRGVPMYLFVPLNPSYPPMVVGCSERDVSKNRIGVADFDSWTANLPRANLRTLLGVCGDRDVEREAIRLAYSPFPEPKEKELSGDGSTSWETRTPLPQKTFNIDPEGCVDIDDVLSIDVDESGLTRLWISIADVSEVLPQNNPITNSAKLKGLTFYDNGFAVSPMLPKWLSEDRCSLLPECWRPTLSLVLTFNEDGSYEDPEWHLTKCWNAQSYMYDTFCERAHEQDIPLDLLKYFTVGVLGEITDDPHKWIEACMLFYNIEAAKLLNQNKVGIFRKHKGKNVESLNLLEKLAETNPDFLEHENLTFLTMSAAEYCSATDTDKRHIGLKEDVYCHASSPIRRFADFVNQQHLKRILGSSVSEPTEVSVFWLNERQKAAKRCEREMFLLDQLTLNQKGTVEALLLDIHPENGSPAVVYKLKLWIPHWKRMVTWKTTIPLPEPAYIGCRLLLSYFCNPSQRRWKDKLVFRLEEVIVHPST
jgi:exoribonuclease R